MVVPAPPPLASPQKPVVQDAGHNLPPVSQSPHPSENPYAHQMGTPQYMGSQHGAPIYGSHGQYHKSDRGGVILTLSISSIFVGLLGCACCILFGPISMALSIPALVMANSDLRSIAAGQMPPMAESTIRAGKVCAIVGICIGILATLLQIGLLAINFTAAFSGM